MSRANGELHLLSRRLLVWIGAGLLVLFVAEIAADLASSDASWADLRTSSGSGKALASTVSRAFNNLCAMVLSFVAIAIPITANMYTPKLVEIFFTDRVNVAALVYFAGMGAHAVFAQFLMFDQWAPVVSVTVLWTSGVVGFAVLIPYYLYVLEYLNPETIIRRVEERVVGAFPPAGRDPGAAGKQRLLDRVNQLGNVILRAVDRADRDVAISAIVALERVVIAYAPARTAAVATWQDVDRDLFPGLSTEAVSLLRRERNWVEYACLRQLHLAYQASLAKMPDAVSAISQVNRRIAVHALRSGDDTTLGLAIRFFNTFIRSAIAKRDAHAVFDVFRQYRGLAVEMLAARPGRSREIVRHLHYYAGLARTQGISFVYELAAADVASIVESAYAATSPAAGEMLGDLRRFRDAKASPRLAKSEAALAAWFRASGRRAEAELLVSDLRRAPAADLAAAKRDFEQTDDPHFWEVTDRQTNLDYLPPDRRAITLALLDELLAEHQNDPR